MGYKRRKYRRPSLRLKNWDYGSNALYYVTLCIKYKKRYFGEIKDGEMYLSEMGIIADQYWMEIPEHFPFAQLDEYIIMPDHIHGIIMIDKEEREDKEEDVGPLHCKIEDKDEDSVGPLHCNGPTPEINERMSNISQNPEAYRPLYAPINPPLRETSDQ